MDFQNKLHMTHRENLLNKLEENKIITDDGLFYANFSAMDYTLSLLENSDKYSSELIYIRDNYGLKRGPEQNPELECNGQYTFGIYIVDWQRCLQDLDDNKRKPKVYKK